MTNKHDYEAALDEFLNGDGYTSEETNEAILHALRLAKKVTGEPSEGMIEEGDKHTSKAWAKGYEADCEAIYAAMISQAQKEIEDGR